MSHTQDNGGWIRKLFSGQPAHQILRTALHLMPVFLAACGGITPTATPVPAITTSLQPSQTSVPAFTPQDTATQTAEPTQTTEPTPTLTATPLTPSATPSPSASPTQAETETPEITATPENPQAAVLEQANCRYGPGSAYLYSHGLYSGDQAQVDGRNGSGTWLWIQPANLDRHCWAAASVLEVNGEVKSLPVVQSRLPQSTLYGPPSSVFAERDGNQVLVTWERVWMTEDDDRGYLIEASVCQNGAQIGVAVQTYENFYEFTDEEGCAGSSGGRLYTVEKHGYTTPVDIPWP